LKGTISIVIYYITISIDVVPIVPFHIEPPSSREAPACVARAAPRAVPPGSPELWRAAREPGGERSGELNGDQKGMGNDLDKYQYLSNSYHYTNSYHYITSFHYVSNQGFLINQ
jgi:hypothetical protein